MPLMRELGRVVLRHLDESSDLDAAFRNCVILSK